MLKKLPKERIPERYDPGENEPEPCSPGSIEQQLDMCTEGTLRGDEIDHSHGQVDRGLAEESERGIDRDMDRRYRVDMSEEGREGDEMSGDEHSGGLQGGEPELLSQPNLDSGLPGDRERRTEKIEGADFIGDEEEGKILFFGPRAKKKSREKKR